MKKIAILDNSLHFRNKINVLINQAGDFDILLPFQNQNLFLKNIISEKPDIIFVDIENSEINGFYITETIIELFPEIKIIEIASKKNDEYSKKLLDIGAKAFMLKSENNI